MSLIASYSHLDLLADVRLLNGSAAHSSSASILPYKGL